MKLEIQRDPSPTKGNLTKPYEFIRFGAMDVAKPYEFIRFGAMDVTKPYRFIGFGAGQLTDPRRAQNRRPWGGPTGADRAFGFNQNRSAPKPYEFIGFGAMEVTKPYEFIGFGAMVWVSHKT